MYKQFADVFMSLLPPDCNEVLDAILGDKEKQQLMPNIAHPMQTYYVLQGLASLRGAVEDFEL